MALPQIMDNSIKLHIVADRVKILPGCKGGPGHIAAGGTIAFCVNSSSLSGTTSARTVSVGKHNI